MTETPILDDRAVSEIEARYELAKDAFHPYAETAKSLADIPALCATVKHLRAENSRLQELLAAELAKRVNTNVERMEQSQKVSQSEIKRTFDDRLPDTQRGSYE